MNPKESFTFLTDQNLFPIQSHALAHVVFFKKVFHLTGYTIIVRPLYLKRDIPTIHTWIKNSNDYNSRGGPQSLENLYHYYNQLLNSEYGYAFMCFIDSNQISVMDMYYVNLCDIKEHYSYEETDVIINLFGFSFNNNLKKLFENIVISCISFLFTFSINSILIKAEANNHDKNESIKRVGFVFLKEIVVENKMVNLYIIQRDSLVVN